ncbi:uncharacterized protein LOC123314357 [Coccinella septempunctata]|uniref:uncharacterized protein LOC123314357 n=1 Tax=Coccinella septempunctata TaxID=41139 RepID=UPI001D0975E1|nr:uncharacterized protein LOC123314357 [Coccinella septempunctata]
MKFLVLFLATVTFASATFIGGKYIDIKEDGTVYIKGEDGKQIYITKHYGPYGQKNFEIEVTGPNNFAKTYQFGYNNQVQYGEGMGYPIFNTLNKNYQDQYDILDVIFREYLGYVDEYTYQQLLNKVHQAVLNGSFDGQVLYILQALVEDPKWNTLVSGQNFYGQIGGFSNKMTQQNKYGLGFFGKFFKTPGFYGQGYNQYDVNYYYNVLMKIFDRQVLKTILIQGEKYNQEIYGQYSYEKMWDMIFTHEGIFDHHYLVEILNNEMLRTWFVQHGFFDKVVLDQIFYAYKTEGVYDQYLLQRLFNTQALKYFFVNRGISVYDILGQTTYNQYGNTFFNKGIYGYNMLEKIITNPTWRNVLVQYGIFDKNVLDQILYRYNTQGLYDQELLTQLVNKQALYNFLVQYGIVDQTVLGKYVDNEYLGLNFLFKNNFFQQTPRTTYKHLFGVPQYTTNMKMYGGEYWKDFLYGQQYYGYNKGPYSYGKLYSPYSYGKSYSPYSLAQQVY